jgi:hypothetical protein
LYFLQEWGKAVFNAIPIISPVSNLEDRLSHIIEDPVTEIKIYGNKS